MKKNKMNAEDFVEHQKQMEKPLIDAAQCGFNTNEEQADTLLGFATDLATLSTRAYSRPNLDQLKKEIEADLYELDDLSIANALLDSEDL